MNKIAISLALALAVSGCKNGNVKDLQAYVDGVKTQQPSNIEPLPEFAPYETYLYSVSNERGPFTPPSSISHEEGLAKVSSNGIKPNFNRAREPLEVEPLDSLRMVGTLAKSGKSFALVRAGDSTIYRVQPGNFLGQNHGKITQVTEAGIDVTEIIPDGLGGWIERQASLALSE
ncbi:MAG: pilus assembly protein PilP [Gammaproteobacteria bacterium]